MIIPILSHDSPMFLGEIPPFSAQSRRWASDFPPLGAEFAGGEAAGCPA